MTALSRTLQNINDIIKREQIGFYMIVMLRALNKYCYLNIFLNYLNIILFK